MALARTRLALYASILLAASQPVLAGDLQPGQIVENRSFTQGIAAVAEHGKDWPRLHSLLVSQGGNLVFERYFNGHGPNELENVKSVSKSVLSVLIGIAIARGDINGVDATLDQFFDEELAAAADPAVRHITVENLLTMQAGLKPTSSENYGAWVASDNWIRTLLDEPLEAQPGKEMLYSTGNTHLLSAILTRATGTSTLQYAREALTKPLGFNLAPWPRDPQGVYMGGNNMEFTPRQMLALGELYLNGGRANGMQVVPERWVYASLAPHARSPHGTSRYYGYGWWVAELAGYKVPHAWGHGGQFIMLVPELDLVIVSTSAPWPGAEAQHHANNVFGLLQRIIRVAGEHGSRREYYASQHADSSVADAAHIALH